MAFYELFTGGIAEQLKLIRKTRYLNADLFTQAFKQSMNSFLTDHSLVYDKDGAKCEADRSTSVELFAVVCEGS
jgi:hypothetical protein